MNITKEQAGKLGKYFINADPFLWGVLRAKNKKGRLKELKKIGVLAGDSQGRHPDLNYLVKNKLYRRPTFITLTTPEVYDSFGSHPPVAGYKDPAFIFVQIETQHNFVERWTVFAGLWFEEIEP